MATKKWQRRLLRIFIILGALIIILILVASPLTKYLIQKYDEKYTGREITVGRAYVNPVTGYISLSDLRIFEQNSDSVFFHTGKIAVDISLLRIIRGVYQVSSLKIDDPEITVIQHDSLFNFSDLIKKFTFTKDTVEEKARKINILNIRLRNGSVKYSGEIIPHVLITDINFSTPGYRSDADSLTGEYSLKPEGANVSGDFMVKMDSLDYRMALSARNLTMGIAEQFLKKYAKNARFTGMVNMDIKARGNGHQAMNTDITGRFSADTIRLRNGEGPDYFWIKKMIVSFNDINIGGHKLFLDSVYVDNPGLLYQRYDTLDNFRRMFKKLLAGKDTVVEPEDTMGIMANLKKADYTVNLLEVQNGNIEFNDYSIAEKFSMAFKPFNLRGDSINKYNRRVKITIKSGIVPYGTFTSSLSMDPENSKYFDLNYNLDNVSASSFNPYIATYTSHQLDKGQIEMHGNWSVRNNNLRALNHFMVINPRTTEKVKGKETKKLPLPLIMAFIRERGSAIDYEIPITGKLDDPKFHFGDVISDLLRNILVKPPTTPYRQQVRKVEESIEKTLNVSWRMRQVAIEKEERDFIERIAGFLKDNPDAYLTVTPVYHEEKEKENILMYEAKKKYFLEAQGKPALSKNDSEKVEKLSSKDSSFIRFMDRKIKNPALLTLQEKCYRFVGRETVVNKFEQLKNERKTAFLYFFKQNGTANRIEFLETKNEIPFNWFSYFRIQYKGEVPEALKEAYQKLYQYNSEPPRRKFFQLRQR